MLLYAEDKVPYLVQHIVHSLTGLIISIFKFKIFIDKFVKILTDLFVLGF